MSEGDNAEHLMSALITKMESMDSNINVLKMENERLNAIVSNPQAMLKRMGMVNCQFVWLRLSIAFQQIQI